VSHLLDAGLIEAEAYHQGEVFESAIRFARCEGTIPAPESAHAIHSTILHALRAREEGKPTVILFNFRPRHSTRCMTRSWAHDELTPDRSPLMMGVRSGRAKRRRWRRVRSLRRVCALPATGVGRRPLRTGVDVNMVPVVVTDSQAAVTALAAPTPFYEDGIEQQSTQFVAERSREPGGPRRERAWRGALKTRGWRSTPGDLLDAGTRPT
jgi:hypothetical protein